MPGLEDPPKVPALPKPPVTERGDPTVEEVSPPSKPAPKAEEPLSALVKLANSATDTEKGSKKKGGGQSSVAWGLIVAGIVAVIVAVLGFAMVWARRKAARLQHEINVRDERALQVKERAKMETRAIERAELEIEASKLDAEVEEMRAERAVLAEKSRKTVLEIQKLAVSSWDDVEISRE